ncbi:response regulator transcription factor [Catenovulum sp. SM1970]|uniref:response regulator transcription factor n=1 Tax=Marinifaba aquimaris TaxID=2741323 RepID=UPI001574726E|nr:response regulator transcription factor [Marinifaba aquimaris]NTS76946.1 response regulator transcription factor [Marinifaba aquimaris]
MTKFLIADDHPLFREALTGALEKTFDDLAIQESENLEKTLSLLEQDDDLDLVLLDLHMPGSGDFYGLIRVRDLYPQLPVAVISGSDDAEIVSKVMGFGALGFISKASSSKQIAEAIEQILEGDTYVPEHLIDQIENLSEEDQALASKISELTPQQYKVLTFVHQGYLNKQIAFELNISEATVKAHMTAIFRKLGVTNRTQAVLIAEKLQLESAAL